MPNAPKKLIEVALPLEEINAASAREKSIRHGHPSTLHLWWARRPLAAARAVIFSQMVDDPSGYVDELRQDAELLRTANRDLKDRLKVWRDKKETFDKASAAGLKLADPGPEPTLDSVLVERERDRLFRLIRQLVQWENTTNESVLEPAREEIRKSWQRTCRREGWAENTPLPAFHDPFAGGGALPLEAQRLGMESYASDLNPVAVLINKAMIEIPPKFAGRPPVNPESRKGQLGTKTWKGAQGLAEDVRYYGKWMRDEAEKRISHLYPKIEITAEMAQERPDLKNLVGQKLTVIAWIWARTVKSPNPAFSHVEVPLASTFMLSTKAGKEAYVEPVIDRDGYRFTVKVGKPKDPEAAKAGTKLSRGANFACVMSGTPMEGDYIKAEGKAGRMGARLMAIVAEGERGRVYLSPTLDHEAAAKKAKPVWKPDVEFFLHALGFRVGNYGMTRWSDLFTDRQLVALTTFSEIVGDAMKRVRTDALTTASEQDNRPLRDGGTGADAYAEAVSVYLAFSVSKASNRASSICTFKTGVQCPGDTFGRHALPMSWDYAEANSVSGPSGSLESMVKNTVAGLLATNAVTGARGVANQADAASQTISTGKVISSDPPYYDNIGYADLSDFFYMWLRSSLRPVFPELFATVAVPKSEELVATPHRHGGSESAEVFFLGGMTQAMHRLTEQAHPAFPVSIYYAFKQSEDETDVGTASTGWETFLEAVIRAGFATTGTWPMRTERENRKRNQDSNALASSIVLVCNRRTANAPMATRKEFVATLQREMPEALRNLQLGNLAPVDLPQSAIGPGMGIFTRYSKVIEADGSAMTVRSALQLINAAIDEFLSAQESQMDDWTRFAVTWFSQHGYQQGPFGDALNLATARNISVDGVRDAGILESGAGKVRLYRPSELPADWDPATDPRLTIWEIVHQMIRLLSEQGEAGAAKVLAKIGALAEDARSLCYRLYTISEQKKWADEARDYNTLIVAWPELTRLAADQSKPVVETQGDLGV
jgi:putative DNA methylase